MGNNLTISSRQDSDRYDSRQNSVAAGGSFTFGSMSGSGYASISQEKIKSNYDSVQDIAGLSRDPEHANDSISPIFDREKEQKRL